jgi:hypothetical protein
MKKFTDFAKRVKMINEEVTPNLPSEIKDMDKDQLIELLKSVKGTQNMDTKPEEKGEEKEENSDSTDISKFFSKLFESREMAHIYHLTVKGEQGSHAAHKALQEYYEGILEFIDEMIEVYQGQYGIIDNYDIIDTKDTKTKDRLEYFNELVEWVKVEKKCIKQEDSHLLNIVDEVVALIYKTIYKLKYNK